MRRGSAKRREKIDIYAILMPRGVGRKYKLGVRLRLYCNCRVASAVKRAYHKDLLILPGGATG